MKTIQAICSVILAVGSATLLCSQAAAADADAPLQRIVSFGDLNLNHPDGVKALYGRLRRAARAVCPRVSSAPYTRRTNARECARTALANAVADINNTNLTAYYNEKTGRDTGEEKLAARR